MDQMITGKFIAQLRKENSWTQAQLAEKLGISDKTISKWERGNGLPEVSLMLPLCELLGISVNELLTGRRLDDSEYRKKAEENMKELIQEKEESKKKIMIAFVVVLITMISGTSLIYLSSVFEMPIWQRILITALGLFTIFGGIGCACVLDMNAGTFECRKCGSRFVPTGSAYIIGVHTITTRHLKCPVCGEKSFCRRRLTH